MGLFRRTRAREVALQLLFQYDFNSTVDRPAIESFVRGRVGEPDLTSFCLKLFDGVQSHRAEIDRAISGVSENWQLSRMTGVDRNVLRLGAFELLFAPETPAPATINEALELARRYGNKDSTAFVNGLLDKIHQSRLPAESTSV